LSTTSLTTTSSSCKPANTTEVRSGMAARHPLRIPQRARDPCPVVVRPLAAHRRSIWLKYRRRASTIIASTTGSCCLRTRPGCCSLYGLLGRSSTIRLWRTRPGWHGDSCDHRAERRRAADPRPAQTDSDCGLWRPGVAAFAARYVQASEHTVGALTAPAVPRTVTSRWSCRPNATCPA